MRGVCGACPAASRIGLREAVSHHMSGSYAGRTEGDAPAQCSDMCVGEVGS